MNPERDAEGNILRDSKGKPVIDKSLNDTEIIPWLTNRNEYLQNNVAPYSPDFIVDEKKLVSAMKFPSLVFSITIHLWNSLLISLKI